MRVHVCVCGLGVGDGEQCFPGVFQLNDKSARRVAFPYIEVHMWDICKQPHVSFVHYSCVVTAEVYKNSNQSD